MHAATINQVADPYQGWDTINRHATDAIMLSLFLVGIVETISLLGGFGIGLIVTVLAVPTLAPLAGVAARVGTEAIEDSRSFSWGIRRLPAYWRWPVYPVAIFGMFTVLITPFIYVLLAAIVAVTMSAVLRSVKATTRVAVS